MKKLLVLFLLPICMIACTSSTTDSTVGKDSVTATPPMPPLPYTAVYSSNFVPGKPSDVATVLANYKAWETNDMAALRATMGDSVKMYFAGGDIFDGTLDSLMKMATKFRDSLSKVEFTIWAWTSNHSVDKNEEWVNIWYKEIDTYKTGKVDSAEYQDDNKLVNGKIVETSSHAQRFKKKK